MAVYEYTGVASATGKTVKGFHDADNVKALRGLLRKEGILLTKATEERERKVRAKKEINFLAFLQAPRTADIAVMTRQLATLIRAGVPLVESITALVEQVEKESLVRVLTQIREGLREGTAFNKCLALHPKVFPPLYINMVEAGEASGTLESVLERLADYMEKQASLKGKVSSALIYPLVLVVIATVLVSVLMIAVVPKVTSIFENLGRELPWYTNLLITVSGVLAGYWWALIILAGTGWYFFQRWKATPGGRLIWDGILISMPLFGRLNLLVAVSRFSSTLATLLRSGVPLLTAMGIVKAVLGNAALEVIIADATAAIREGESIADPLKRSGKFPPMLTHMIAVGERSGQLEEMLENVSRAYEADVEQKVAALTRSLEPLIILVMGAMVGFIAMAILMPLVQMNELVD